MVIAIIPAAGRSRRMGVAKLGLLLGDCTVLEHVVKAVRQSKGVEACFVVLGPASIGLASVLERAGRTGRGECRLHVVQLDADTPDMRQTVEAGLRETDALYRPTPDDAFLLVPADTPMLRTGTIDRLLARAMSRGAIRVPTFRGKRGHPTLFSYALVDELLRLPTDEGINRLVAMYPQSVEDVAIDDESVLIDLDTPGDYERVLERIGRKDGPVEP